MKNPAVDAWFAAKKHPLEDAMQEVRRITLAADPRIEESIKWSTPTFSYKGNIFSFNPAKKFVSLLFHTGASIPGSHPRLEGEGDTARVMRFTNLAEVKAGSKQLTAVIKAWCKSRDAR
ncbi:MAG TPA: DUF1801 domain-containing protein [Acidimicrobiia bacterium]|jgi:hypothetical protein